jgi:hypothetical protein
MIQTDTEIALLNFSIEAGILLSGNGVPHAHDSRFGVSHPRPCGQRRARLRLSDRVCCHGHVGASLRPRRMPAPSLRPAPSLQQVTELTSLQQVTELMPAPSLQQVTEFTGHLPAGAQAERSGWPGAGMSLRRHSAATVTVTIGVKQLQVGKANIKLPRGTGSRAGFRVRPAALAGHWHSSQ